ncbi:MAG: hypothetical protein ACE5GF_09180, partial [Thermodesulfobacteriota bacterium]
QPTTVKRFLQQQEEVWIQLKYRLFALSCTLVRSLCMTIGEVFVTPLVTTIVFQKEMSINMRHSRWGFK